MTTLREALERIKGGHFSGASTLAIAGDWHAMFDALQSIAAQALADNPVDADKREKIARALDRMTEPGTRTIDEIVDAIIAELDQ